MVPKDGESLAVLRNEVIAKVSQTPEAKRDTIKIDSIYNCRIHGITKSQIKSANSTCTTTKLGTRRRNCRQYGLELGKANKRHHDKEPERCLEGDRNC